MYTDDTSYIDKKLNAEIEKVLDILKKNSHGTDVLFWTRILLMLTVARKNMC